MGAVESGLLRLGGGGGASEQAGVTHRRYEVRGSGGHSGPGGGRRVPESFGQEGPHHSVAGEEQPPTQQPQGDVELGKRSERLVSSLERLRGITRAGPVGGFQNKHNLSKRLYCGGPLPVRTNTTVLQFPRRKRAALASPRICISSWLRSDWR